jgi:hypothetical protein
MRYRALVTALAVIATTLGMTAGAAAQSATPGPGLGESPGAPQGRAVTLALPDGYTLRSIRGGEPTDVALACLEFDHANPPAACAMMRGRYSLTLELQVEAGAEADQTSNASLCATPPAWSGWVLPSVDATAQNLMVPIYACTTGDGLVTPVIELPAGPRPAGGTVEAVVSGYCLNASRPVPGTESLFETGVVTDDAGLLLILAALEGKDLYDSGAQFPVQAVVWDYTEAGNLSLEQLEVLAQLP